MFKIVQGVKMIKCLGVALTLTSLSIAKDGWAQRMSNSQTAFTRMKWQTPSISNTPFLENLRFELGRDTPEISTKNSSFKLDNDPLFSSLKIDDIASITLGSLENTSLGLNNLLMHESNSNKDPLVLKNFQSGFENSRPVLQWISSVEDNLNFYCVQRSTDGLEFQDVAFVFPEGVHLVDSKYNFIDNEIPSGTIGVLYYRLKMKDASGSEEFSTVKTIYLGLNDRSVLQRSMFDGHIKTLSYTVRTLQRPELEPEQDVHPWPSLESANQKESNWNDYKIQWQDKMKSLWSKTSKLVQSF